MSRLLIPAVTGSPRCGRCFGGRPRPLCERTGKMFPLALFIYATPRNLLPTPQLGILDGLGSRILSSAYQSGSAKSGPCRSGCQERGSDLISVIPARGGTGAIHAATPTRSALICSNVRPSPSSVASLPTRDCHLVTTTSTYFGSSSMPRQTRSVSSAAASVVPLPRNGSYTTSPRLVWFRTGRRISSTGFWVGWSNFSSSDPPIMNFGLGESQTVEFSPALPYQGAFFFRTYQTGSCWNQ